jgi:hypothetical protein
VSGVSFFLNKEEKDGDEYDLLGWREKYTVRDWYAAYFWFFVLAVRLFAPRVQSPAVRECHN